LRTPLGNGSAANPPDEAAKKPAALGNRRTAVDTALNKSRRLALALAVLSIRDMNDPTPEATAATLLDRFMPSYDVAKRYAVRVPTTPAEALAIAGGVDINDVWAVRAIFRCREILLGATPGPARPPRGLLADMQSLGWVILAETPGREVVAGAVTRPWEANVTFRSIPAAQFAAFAEADYVKIVWNLRANPTGPSASVFSTETRVTATDAEARAKFRRYWRLMSPGIIVLRWLLLRQVKHAIGHRTRHASPAKVETHGVAR
jgi:hypothetical protein